MQSRDPKAQEFIQQSDAVVDRLRAVALREFDQGVSGLQAIVQELTTVADNARQSQLPILADCLSEIAERVRAWASEAAIVQELPQRAHAWAELIYELSNYFMFMADEDENELRKRIDFRLQQLPQPHSPTVEAVRPGDAQAAAVAVAVTAAEAIPLPAPAPAPASASWGLFDDTESVKPEAKPENPTLVPAKPAAAMETAPRVKVQEPPMDKLLASHYLICLLGSQQYALPIHQVREILEARDEKALPSKREGIMGLVSVRGQVCPVVDVSSILHAKHEDLSQIPSGKRCMVVCEVDRRTFCFNVDDVKQVAALDEFEEQIKPLNPESNTQRAISHVSHFQSKSVLFVKMREVIPA